MACMFQTTAASRRVRAQTYPREMNAHRFLLLPYVVSGKYEKALEENRKMVELRPDFAEGYVLLADSYQRVDPCREPSPGLSTTLRRSATPQSRPTCFALIRLTRRACWQRPGSVAALAVSTSRSMSRTC